MRELKFRWWNYIRDEMEFFVDWLPTEHEGAMQYTGLKDKNGKEIYEGDVVNVQLHWVTDKLHTAKVVWREDQAMFMVAVDHKNDDGILFYELHKLRSILIIGNIYENKDLL